MNYTWMDSSIGRLLLGADDNGLRFIDFSRDGESKRPLSQWCENADALRFVSQQLEEYFANERQAFDVKLAPEGTQFQQRVWQTLLDIPYGLTTSYGEIARRIGQPTASRAVGLANGSNPIPIIIPCHRVIGSNGKLTGYGGGLDLKERLLKLERGATLF